MSKFKKLAVASAIAAVGSTSAFAVTMGEPGAALLVPLAVYSSADQVNTLVGITKLNALGPGGAGQVDDDGLTAVPFPTASISGGASNDLHWFFFNDQSVHQLDGPLTVTSQGFVGFDLGAQIVVADGGVGGAHDGMRGYLVFTDNQQFTSAGANGSDVNLYGDAAIITGNWGAAAYIPVMPLADDGANAISVTDHVTYLPSGIPAQVTPVTAGMQMNSVTNVAGYTSVSFNMRYFVNNLGLGGNARTDLVVWMPRNNVGYVNQPINIYDTNQVANSANINLPREVNVVNAGSLPWVASKGAGHVEITLPTTLAVHRYDAAVGFSLVYFGPAATDGVQTILAHERGIR